MVAQVFSGPDAPTALFLMADFWAPPVYAELKRLGLRVPEDVALVGFDDVVPPGLDDLELTSMAQDFEGIGRTAGELVLRRIADPTLPFVSHVFPARLVVRRSSQDSHRPVALPGSPAASERPLFEMKRAPVAVG